MFDTETEIWTELKFPLSSKKNGISIYSAYFTIGPVYRISYNLFIFFLIINFLKINLVYFCVWWRTT